MSQERREKHFYEKWWFWAMAVIIVLAFTSGGQDTDSANKSLDNGVQETLGFKSKKQSSNSNEATLTLEKFNQIKIGMTYEEVVEIMGSEGEVSSESGTKGERGHFIIYDFLGDNYSEASMSFDENILVSRHQYGLSGDSDIEVTLEQFNQLQTGMTYEEVIEILGGEGVLLSEYGEEGEDYYSATYQYLGNGKYSDATLYFVEGKLDNKSQYGLD